MTNVEYVRNVLLSCPFITVGKLKMHVDFIGTTPLNYSITAEPADPVVKRYLDGGAHERFVFALYSRRDAPDDNARIQNMANYENLNSWLQNQQRLRLFPPMDDGKQLIAWLPISATFVSEREDGQGAFLYLMQYQLEYYNTGG